jgi:hypothetical protein
MQSQVQVLKSASGSYYVFSFLIATSRVNPEIRVVYTVVASTAALDARAFDMSSCPHATGVRRESWDSLHI